MHSFETKSVTMSAMFLVTVQAPVEDVARILKAVIDIEPLAMGKYDSNAFITASGLEHYRPREGAFAGTEDTPRQRPGVCEICFQLPLDQNTLSDITEAIFQVHSYQEPVIIVREVLASRSKGLDDSKNPNRWWNTTGDWKMS
jgi:hypothetical protein